VIWFVSVVCAAGVSFEFLVEFLVGIKEGVVDLFPDIEFEKSVLQCCWLP